jgi:hypothetical protein
MLGYDNGAVVQMGVRGQVQREWQHASRVAALIPTAQWLVTGCSDGRLSTWSWEGSLLQQVQHPGGVIAAAVTAGRGRIASVGRDHALRMWGKDGEVLVAQKLSAAPIAVAALSDGRRVLTATGEGQLEVWSSDAAS